ncbi:MAG TPA: methyltransferase domain-containing protein [Thermoleophilaceae bacterium]|nr:methyltransferase domain-containing protein [Thermoleophilaceae bacterium]
MLAESLERFDREVPASASVLDVGGWAKPLTRADWVLDVMPYATRGLLGSDGDGPERFGEETWVERDICDRTPWPFEDDQFDFVVCSHVLEDIRDPLWVASELSRVAKAGYVEVPSRLEEQSRGLQGDWVGWGHHHWLIELEGDRFDFLFKPHIIHSREEFWFPHSFWTGLTEEQRVERLWWTGSFETREVLLFGPGELDEDLAGFVSRHMPDRPPPPRRGLRQRARALAGRS